MTLSFPATPPKSSTFTLATTALSPIASATASTSGPTIRQGPHHGAQKSNHTGLSPPESNAWNSCSLATFTILIVFPPSSPTPGGRFTFIVARPEPTVKRKVIKNFRAKKKTVAITAVFFFAGRQVLNKPSSVPRNCAATIIYLGRQLPDGSSDATRKVQRAASSLPYSVLLRMGFT